jgi:putative SOS response-associated peptidase YedK
MCQEAFHGKDNAHHQLVSLRWGLIPFWGGDLKTFKDFSSINARADCDYHLIVNDLSINIGYTAP